MKGREAQEKSSEDNGKSVQNKQDSRGERSESEESGSEGDSVHFSSSSSEGSLGQSLSSGDSESGADSSSEEDAQEAATRQKRFRDGADASLSRSRSDSGASEAKRATRYVRQLALALRIDSGWAREIYDECAAQGTHSYEGLLRYFYRTECERAKGTQKETAKPLTLVRKSTRSPRGDKAIQ